MQKRGAIELSAGFMVMLIICIVILILGIVFVQKIFFASSAKADAENAKNDIARLGSSDEPISVDPTTIQRQGTVYLMITNDDTVGSSKFGFKVSYYDCYNGDCGASSPMDWISYSTKGNEETPIDIEPYESRTFIIAVNPKGNVPSGVYSFKVEVRYENNGISDSYVLGC
jgi:hypothetical protein